MRHEENFRGEGSLSRVRSHARLLEHQIEDPGTELYFALFLGIIKLEFN